MGKPAAWTMQSENMLTTSELNENIIAEQLKPHNIRLPAESEPSQPVLVPVASKPAPAVVSGSRQAAQSNQLAPAPTTALPLTMQYSIQAPDSLQGGSATVPMVGGKAQIRTRGASVNVPANTKPKSQQYAAQQAAAKVQPQAVARHASTPNSGMPALVSLQSPRQSPPLGAAGSFRSGQVSPRMVSQSLRCQHVHQQSRMTGKISAS